MDRRSRAPRRRGKATAAAITAAGGGCLLAVFRLTPAGAWQQNQLVSVPVQLGSSS